MPAVGVACAIAKPCRFEDNPAALVVRPDWKVFAMLKFRVFDDDGPADAFPIRNAHLIGSDQTAMRATISFADGVIQCDKSDSGVAALALQLPVGVCGELTVQTCLLQDRDEPYLLSLELARHRLMNVYHKSEDWGMFDIHSEHPVSKRIDAARKLFIEALGLQAQKPAEADALVRESLGLSIDGSEELALAHADLLLNRRKSTGALPRHALGAGVPLEQTDPRLRNGVLSHFDFLMLPTPWKQLAPEEGSYRWDALAQWVDWAGDQEMPVVAGPLVSFEPANLPDWLFIWENDYQTVRDLIYEHIEQVVNRFKDSVATWVVASGLHVNNHFTIAFDQLIDLTRMATMVVKKVQPDAKVLVEIVQPFGEYYAANQRSIPPMMYADLLLQGGVNLDGLVLQLTMGQALPGQYTRDLMQISSLLDQFAAFGKPVTVSIGVPSAAVTEEMISVAHAGSAGDANCGYWRQAWSPLVQAQWVEAVLHVALSKPFVEAVSWCELCDHPDIVLPMGGLVTEDLQPKDAFRRIAGVRRILAQEGPMVLVNEAPAESS
jgi:hypothetical protein